MMQFITLIALCWLGSGYALHSHKGYHFKGPSGWVQEVKTLPGWPQTQPLPSRMYSGFVNITNAPPPPPSLPQEMLMHYILFESENDPANDPVIVWWNGGPGATSMWGLFVELGPLMLNAESLIGPEYNKTGIPQLIANPYAWTKYASVVAFGSPPPVGFSYCNPPGVQGNGSSCGAWSDGRVGVTDAQALEIIFFQHFPNLLFNTPNKPLYFVGESYAGVFIAETGKVMNANPQVYGPILQHLRGVGFGDSCVGSAIMCDAKDSAPWYKLFFMIGHQQFSNEQWLKINLVCSVAELHTKGGTLSPVCQEAVNEAYNQVSGYFPYSLYNACPNNTFSMERLIAHHSSKARVGEEHLLEAPIADNIPLVDGYFCDDGVFFTYFNRADVREAIFVDPNSNCFNADDGNGMIYIYSEQNIMPWVASLLNPTNNTLYPQPVKIMVYNGDTDPGVLALEAQDVWSAFARNYSIPKTAEWRGWTFDKEQTNVGGAVIEWRDGDLQFVTIRGSGHMVGEYKPIPAYTMMGSFVTGRKLPPFTPPNSWMARRRI